MFWRNNLPEADFGKDFQIEINLGNLYLARDFCSQYCLISSNDNLASVTITATTISPHSRSPMPTTQASAIAGCYTKIASISVG